MAQAKSLGNQIWLLHLIHQQILSVLPSKISIFQSLFTTSTATILVQHHNFSPGLLQKPTIWSPCFCPILQWQPDHTYSSLFKTSSFSSQSKSQSLQRPLGPPWSGTLESHLLIPLPSLTFSGHPALLLFLQYTNSPLQYSSPCCFLCLAPSSWRDTCSLSHLSHTFPGYSLSR